MYLDGVLGTRTKVNALSALLTNGKYLESELARAINASVSEVNRQMPGLVSIGLVHLERVGKSKVYSINEENLLYAPLKSLFADLNALLEKEARLMARYATKHFKGGLKAVILFGSVSKQSAHEASDVDLLFVFNKKSVQEAERALNDYAHSRGAICKPLVVSLEGYSKKLEKGDAFYSLVQAEGVLLYGKKPKGIML